MNIKKLVVLISVFTIAGCAKTNMVTKEFKPEHIIHYSKLQQLANVANLHSYVVYLNKGDTFPLELSLDTGIIRSADNKIDLVAEQKLYFRVKMPENLSKQELAELESLSKEKLSEMTESDREEFFKNYMIYISKDAINWAPLNDIRAMKELIGTKGGTISLGMGMTNKDGIWSYLNVETIK